MDGRADDVERYGTRLLQHEMGRGSYACCAVLCWLCSEFAMVKVQKPQRRLCLQRTFLAGGVVVVSGACADESG